MALYRRDDPSGALLASDGARPRPRNSAGTYYRAQNSPLKEPAPARSADEVTLPPFDMVASREARADQATAATPWQRPDSPSPARRPARPAAPTADSVDPGAPVTTELAMEPSPEARALDRPEPPAPRRPRATPASSPSTGRSWKPAAQALPDLGGPN